MLKLDVKLHPSEVGGWTSDGRGSNWKSEVRSWGLDALTSDRICIYLTHSWRQPTNSSEKLHLLQPRHMGHRPKHKKRNLWLLWMSSTTDRLLQWIRSVMSAYIKSVFMRLKKDCRKWTRRLHVQLGITNWLTWGICDDKYLINVPSVYLSQRKVTSVVISSTCTIIIQWRK